MSNSLSWSGIVRLGLVQTALGAIVVLTTSTLNRVMVVELALPAMLPGALVALHYAMQVLRPCMGYGSDVGGRRTPWIVGGMAALAVGGVLAAAATALMGTELAGGVALAAVAFMLIGGGVSAAGTSLLVLLAKRVDSGRRAAAATIVWLMMIAGFAVTATAAGHFLDPYSPARLIAVASFVSVAALFLAFLAVRNVEGPAPASGSSAGGASTPPKPTFREALTQVWAEPSARRFTIFVFVSMLAYSAQDLIVEPFAGAVFGYSPGQSTQLAGIQHGGVLLGMILVALAASGLKLGALRTWTIGGCVASAAALLGLAAVGWMGLIAWPLWVFVFLLGFANGAFAVAAIASMMSLASSGRHGREGVRMGLWGAAQAIAFGLGGFLGAAASDVARALLAAPGPAYAVVFAGEGMLFLVAAWLAARVSSLQRQNLKPQISTHREVYAAGVKP